MSSQGPSSCLGHIRALGEVFILPLLVPSVAEGVSLFSKARAVGSLPLKIGGEVGNGGGIREERAVVRSPR